jgi:hypothetical protein
MMLVEPATVFNGVLKLSENDFKIKANFYETHKSNLILLKFVPASGAASRMFHFLSVFLNEFDLLNETINAYINRKKDNELAIFIVGMDKFPFYEAIDKKLKEELVDFDALHRDYKNYYFIKLLLSPDYFDFANKPKGTLPFHNYGTTIVTPIEEHLNECGYYSSSNGVSHLHFTVSEIHQQQFETTINSIKSKVEKQSGTAINVSYSYQNKSTDTIAVDALNNPFRNEKGELVFRPGGHGALIENLNNLNADIVFIKNIDNVIQNNNVKVARYKKALAGIVLEYQQQVFAYLNLLDDTTVEQDMIEEITCFLKEKLNREMHDTFAVLSLEDKNSAVKGVLNRPIRVCGMVKNEGEPGGGPYWVKGQNGVVSLQIVESSQVDMNDEKQVKLMGRATHFNPVDLVCGITNYKNEKFDLKDFVDPDSGFIAEKNTAGINIKAYELPGLWNGAMANWLTVFVQVPLLTFNSVKTVNDLLKSAHQPQ